MGSLEDFEAGIRKEKAQGSGAAPTDWAAPTPGRVRSCPSKPPSPAPRPPTLAPPHQFPREGTPLLPMSRRVAAQGQDSGGQPAAAATWAEYAAGAATGYAFPVIVHICDSTGNPTRQPAQLSVKIKGPTVVSSTARDQLDGTWLVQFKPTISGVYKISIKLGTQAIQDSPLSVPATESRTHAASCYLVKGAQNAEVLAGEEQEVVIQSVDQLGNKRQRGGDQFSLQVLTGKRGLEHIPNRLEDLKNGQYLVRFTPTLIGTLSLSLMYGNQHIRDSPLHLTVVPGNFSAPHSQVLGMEELNDLETGLEHSLSVLACDRFGNAIHRGGLELNPVFAGTDGAMSFSALVDDEGDGRYVIRIMCKSTGPFQLAIFHRNQLVTGKRLTGYVSSGRSVPGKSVFLARHFDEVVAGERASFLLQARDRFGNDQQDGGDRYEMIFSSGLVPLVKKEETPGVVTWTAGLLEHAMVDKKNGTYQGYFVPQVAGAHSISLVLDHHGLVFGSPYTVQVLAAAVDPAMTEVVGAGTHDGRVGETISFTVRLRDRFGNLRPTGRASVVAKLQGPKKASADAADFKVAVSDVGQGTYLVAFAPPTTGRFIIEVSVNGQKVAADYVLNVSAEAVSARHSRVAGVVTEVEAGGESPLRLGVILRDRFGSDMSSTVKLADLNVRILAVGPSPAVGFLKQVAAEGGKPGACVLEAVVSPVEPGIYHVSAFLGEVELPGSPVKCEVLRTRVLPHAFGPGVAPSVKAGQPTEIYLELFDRDGHPRRASSTDKLKVEVKSTSGPVPVKMLAPSHGCSVFEYSVPRVGSLQVHCTVNGRPVPSSPFAVDVVADQPSPGQCYVVDPAVLRQPAVAGVGMRFTVQACDSSGNALKRGGDVFVATLLGSDVVSGVVSDVGDGTYQVELLPERIGSFTVEVQLGRGGGGGIRGSPFQLTVEPGAWSANRSHVHGPGLSPVTAGEKGIVTLQLADQFGNLCASDLAHSAAGQSVRVAVALRPEVAPLSSHWAQLRSSGGGGAFEATATPPPPLQKASSGSGFSALQSVLAGQSPPQSAATSPAERVQATLARRASRQALRRGNSSAAAPAASSSLSPHQQTTLADSGDGTLTVSWVCEKAGPHALHVEVNGEAVRGSPFPLITSAATLDIAQCVVEKPPTGSVVTGEPMTCIVSSFDRFGNACTQGGGKFSSVVTRGTETFLAAVYDSGDGRYLVVYTPTLKKGGPHQIAVTAAGGRHVRNSPFTVQVLSEEDAHLKQHGGSRQAAQWTLVGLPASALVQAGTRVTLQLERSDRKLGPLGTGQLFLKTPQGAAAAVKGVEDTGKGRLKFVFEASVAGVYSVELQGYAGGGDTASPRRLVALITVRPGKVTASKCYYSGVDGKGASTPVAGQYGRFLLVTADQFGNPIQESPARALRVQLEPRGGGADLTAAPVICETTDLGNGTFVIEFFARQAGSFQIQGTLGGMVIPAPKRLLQVSGAPIDPSQCVATGSTLSIARVDAVNRFEITTHDQWGNLVVQDDPNSPPPAFLVELVGIRLQVFGEAEKVGPGKYAGSFKPRVEGPHCLAVTLMGVPIKGSPFQVKAVEAGAPELEESVSLGGLLEAREESKRVRNTPQQVVRARQTLARSDSGSGAAGTSKRIGSLFSTMQEFRQEDGEMAADEAADIVALSGTLAKRKTPTTAQDTPPRMTVTDSTPPKSSRTASTARDVLGSARAILEKRKQSYEDSRSAYRNLGPDSTPPARKQAAGYKDSDAPSSAPPLSRGTSTASSASTGSARDRVLARIAARKAAAQEAADAREREQMEHLQRDFQAMQAAQQDQEGVQEEEEEEPQEEPPIENGFVDHPEEGEEPVEEMPIRDRRTRVMEPFDGEELPPEPEYEENVEDQPVEGEEYPPEEGEYLPEEGDFPPEEGEYFPEEGEYAPEEEGEYPPEEEGEYPPEEGEYPLEEFPPEEGEFLPEEGGEYYPEDGEEEPPLEDGPFDDLRSEASLRAEEELTAILDEGERHEAVTAQTPILLVAMWDFNPNGDGQLALRKGEVVTLLDGAPEDDWYYGENDSGEKGDFPSAFVAPYASADQANMAKSSSANSGRGGSGQELPLADGEGDPPAVISDRQGSQPGKGAVRVSAVRSSSEASNPTAPTGPSTTLGSRTSPFSTPSSGSSLNLLEGLDEDDLLQPLPIQAAPQKASALKSPSVSVRSAGDLAAIRVRLAANKR